MVNNKSPSYFLTPFLPDFGVSREMSAFEMWLVGFSSLSSHRADGKSSFQSFFLSLLTILEQTSLDWLVCSPFTTDTKPITLPPLTLLHPSREQMHLSLSIPSYVSSSMRQFVKPEESMTITTQDDSLVIPQQQQQQNNTYPLSTVATPPSINYTLSDSPISDLLEEQLSKVL